MTQTQNKECICGTKQFICSDDPEMNDCGFCSELNIYEPCPVFGYGCGELCGCCSPMQQSAAKIALN